MNKEVLFAKTLEEVRKTAKEQGNCISEEQVKEAFAELDLSGEQLQMVFDYLLKHKIGIGQPMDPDEFLTDEEKDYLQEYLDEVAALPVYTDGEKQAFSIAAMAGETDAQQRLIEIYLADVAEIAKLYAGQGVMLEDLVGEGNLALSFGVTMLGSLEKPEEVEGMLGKMIMDAMEEYIAEHTENSKIDKRVEDKVNKVADKARELAEELQRKVTIEELMEETGMSRKMIEDAVRMSGFKIEISTTMQKTVYENYKYSLQDTAKVYIGAKYTFAELLEQDEVAFKFRLIVERYILAEKEVDPEDTLETHLYYLKPDSFLVKIYDRIKARVKINIIEEKKGIFGRGKKRYVTKELNIRELTAMTPEEKEAKGVVIQEISMSKLALAGF